MSARTTIPIASTKRHAEDLLDLLVDAGPTTGADVCEKFGWTRSRFDAALRYARDHLCPALGMAIPNPTPSERWQYQVTCEWAPVEMGATYALGQVESRLTGIHRDVRIVLPHLEKGTREWRRANFLNKHLSHVLGTLSEISNG